MFPKSHQELHSIRDGIETLKRLSDRIIGVGPWNIVGIDGILALLPFPLLGTAYSVLAGVFLIIQGIRARVSIGTLLLCLLILLVDSGITTVEDLTKMVPFAGPLVALLPGAIDFLFQGHLYAAHLIQKDIEKTHYVAGSEADARLSGEHDGHLADMKSDMTKKRLVYLG